MNVLVELAIAGGCGLWLWNLLDSKQKGRLEFPKPDGGKVVVHMSNRERRHRVRLIEQSLEINRLLEEAYLEAGRRGPVKAFIDARPRWAKPGESGFMCSEEHMRKTGHLPPNKRMSSRQFVELIKQGKITQ